MANNPSILVEERSRDIGDFMVGRLLPFIRKRQVGPFTFIDHMGPALLGPTKYVDVDQHPHIGLSTLTYLLEGTIEHRDSTGASQEIKPGDVGFMTAGKAVSHTERTPASQRMGQVKMHGYQVWVALPKEKEDIDPSFQYVSGEDLPQWKDGDLSLKLIAGNGFDRASPLQVYSDLFMIDIIAGENDSPLNIAGQLTGEIAIVVTKGSVQTEGESIHEGQMLISKTEDQCQITIGAQSRILLFGGTVLPEERFLYWNFVSSDKEKIEKAKEKWSSKEFPKVPGDDTYIALPD